MTAGTDTLTTLDALDTPAALIDSGRMQRNIQRMQQQARALGVRLRPHAKTSKCAEVVRAQLDAGAQGITVSTLKEAVEFFEAGVSDILYAVGISPQRLPQALALRRRGCNLKIITDNLAGAQAIVDLGRCEGEIFPVLIEVDTDGHRSGIQPEEASLIEVGRVLSQAGMLAGVMTHAGSSYELDTPDALAAMAEQERAGCVRAAERLRAAGLPCEVVSVGSTPTALSARTLDGVTELRAGVYVFFDLVMYNVGVCQVDEVALSVLTTVIGHQPDRGWVIVDAGWMAMSRDRGTARQRKDCGYGLVCDASGALLPGVQMVGANQEHGILAFEGVPSTDVVQRFPVGTRLRILPNHACATATQHPRYQVLDEDGGVKVWPRFFGW